MYYCSHIKKWKYFHFKLLQKINRRVTNLQKKNWFWNLVHSIDDKNWAFTFSLSQFEKRKRYVGRIKPGQMLHANNTSVAWIGSTFAWHFANWNSPCNCKSSCQFDLNEMGSLSWGNVIGFVIFWRQKDRFCVFRWLLEQNRSFENS